MSETTCTLNILNIAEAFYQYGNLLRFIPVHSPQGLPLSICGRGPAGCNLFRVLAAAPAEGVSPLPSSCRLIAQLAPGQRQEHALKTWAIDRQPAHPAAEFLKERLGRGVAVSFDHERAVAARRSATNLGGRISRPDRISRRGVLRNHPNKLAPMSCFQRRRRIDRDDAAAVHDADAG